MTADELDARLAEELTEELVLECIHFIYFHPSIEKKLRDVLATLVPARQLSLADQTVLLRRMCYAVRKVPDDRLRQTIRRITLKIHSGYFSR